MRFNFALFMNVIVVFLFMYFFYFLWNIPYSSDVAREFMQEQDKILQEQGLNNGRK
ncbi:hypothetical protein [Campylobacter sp. RM9328]|uniref:hypothetical protein n=1 Tax=Campylobacter sp. RM9328 TaxID=1705720 RepID=UPI00147631E9|nr:hypothetical protein [Campylobacter sp. RM9328]